MRKFSALTCGIVILAASSVQAVVVPLSGGDAGDGLDLSGYTKVYALDVGDSSATSVMQGISFTAKSIGETGVTIKSQEYNFSAAFPAFASPTANDTALSSMLSDVQAGRFSVEYDTTPGTTYRLVLICGGGTGLGGFGSGYAGDFGFKNGAWSSNDAAYTLIHDNVVTTPEQAYAIVYDYTATSTKSSFLGIYPNTLGATYSGAANGAGALPVGAFGVFTLAAVSGASVWNATGSADWNAPGGTSWTGGIPNAIDAQAEFTNAIAANSTVNTDINVTVGTIKFDSAKRYLVTGQGNITLSSATTALINVVSGSHALAPRKLEFASDTTVTVASGASLTLAGLFDGIVIEANKHVTTSGTVNFNSPVTLQTGSHLNLASSSFAPSLTMAVSAAATLATHGGSTPSVLQVNSLSVDPAASLQLNNNALLVHGGSLNSIETAVGNGSIATSLATSDASGRTALGVAIAGDVGLTGTTIGGVTLAASDVLVKPTYYGDANLSGTVDGADYTRIDAGYGSNGSLKGWEHGDFNHDNAIDGSDYSLIDGSFGAALSAFPASSVATPAASIAGPVSVPEPTTMGLLALGATTLLRRRRK